MQTKSFRIDRYLSKQLKINRRDIKLMLAQGRIIINGATIREVNTIVEEFDQVVFDGEVLQDKNPLYIMLNKPVGVVSATKDELHKTVIELLSGYSTEQLESLHNCRAARFKYFGLIVINQ